MMYGELARKLNFVRGEYREVKYTKPKLFAKLFRGERPREIIPDSREELEKMGFEILSEADRFMYKVKLPEGWKIIPTEHEYWSLVIDVGGDERISQFRKVHAPLAPPFRYMESEEARTENAFLDIK